MKNLILIALSILSLTSHAGQEGGGGGIGIGMPNGSIYLYDFLEAGIEENSYVNISLSDQMNASEAVQNTMANPEVQKLIVNKLNEVYLIAPEAALKFLDVIKTYQWRYVLPKVKETNDRGYTPVRIENQQLQIAFRDDDYKIVTIDREYLKKMPILHQVGLYFHEILYAMTYANCIENETYATLSCEFRPWSSDENKLSYRARMFTSYLFHPNFKIQTTEAFTNFYNSTVISQSKVKSSFTPLAVYQFVNSADFRAQCNQFKNEFNQLMVEGGHNFSKMHEAIWNSIKHFPNKRYEYNEVTHEVRGYPFLSGDYDSVDNYGIFQLLVEGKEYYYPTYAKDFVISNDISIVIKTHKGISNKNKSIQLDRNAIQNSANKFRIFKERHSQIFHNRCIYDEQYLKIINTYSQLQVATK
ncbi:MAG: hypothetical protein V4596_07985 [Bdellovibrionota bacterium]